MNSISSEKKLLTIEEAAHLLGIKKSRIRIAVFRREIPYIKIGRLVRFDQAKLKTWLDKLSISEGK